ncbi:hypothetical protein EV368DRAFT_18718, partial [Lentinula lateritia]
TFTHAKRRAKAKAMEDWRKEHARRPLRGGFALANGLPPRWKPRDYFNNTPREVYGRLIQCRTRHAFLGEYYAKFVPTEPIQCPCGARTQTRDHIIQTCEIYDDYRDLLWNVSDDLDIGEILGTEEGIEALAEFIEKSGAFKK